MEKAISAPVVQTTRPKSQRVLRFQRLIGFFICCIVVVQSFRLLTVQDTFTGVPPCCRPCKSVSHHRRGELRAICKSIRTPAGPPPTCDKRTESDRYVPGTPPVLLRNGMIWTGARNGTEIVHGDVLLDKGLVVAVGYIPPSLLDGARQSSRSEIRVEDLEGAWVTPGLVDLHSHLGVSSAPGLRGQSLSFPPQYNISMLETYILLFFKVHPTVILTMRLFSHGFEV